VPITFGGPDAGDGLLVGLVVGLVGDAGALVAGGEVVLAPLVLRSSPPQELMRPAARASDASEHHVRRPMPADSSADG
jgi:hypothetical protein